MVVVVLLHVYYVYECLVGFVRTERYFPLNVYNTSAASVSAWYAYFTYFDKKRTKKNTYQGRQSWRYGRD